MKPVKPIFQGELHVDRDLMTMDEFPHYYFNIDNLLSKHA